MQLDRFTFCKCTHNAFPLHQVLAIVLLEILVFSSSTNLELIIDIHCNVPPHFSDVIVLLRADSQLQTYNSIEIS